MRVHPLIVLAVIGAVAWYLTRTVAAQPVATFTNVMPVAPAPDAPTNTAAAA
jgi:hypothetical protein